MAKKTDTFFSSNDDDTTDESVYICILIKIKFPGHSSIPPTFNYLHICRLEVITVSSKMPLFLKSKQATRKPALTVL